MFVISFEFGLVVVYPRFSILSFFHSIKKVVADDRSIIELIKLLGTCFSVLNRPQKSSSNHDIGVTLPSSADSSGIVPPATPDGEIVWPQELQSFRLSELKAATKDFQQDGLLGESTYGPVFKGWIDQRTLTASTPENGVAVAVKTVQPEGPRGRHEWLTEIKYLGHLQHPNLVKLVGYCIEDNLCLLVCEYLNRGSLEYRVCRTDASKWTTLSWDVRMKIMLSLAKCLSFLHHDAQVTHRSFSASNILLDSDNNVKLADFGLVVEEQIGGLSVKDDVYMFGVVLLQMLSGRQIVDNSRLPDEQNLVEWAMPYITNKRRVFRVMDARLEGRYPSSGVLRTVELVVRCLSPEPRLRPDMKEVVKAMEQIQDSQ